MEFPKLSILLVFWLSFNGSVKAATSGEQGAPVPDSALRSVLNTVRSSQGEHSVCYLYADHNNKTVEGINTDGQVRLASVTKLLTSYWVLANLGPRYRFNTQFIWDATTAELFILGSKDPFFSKRRIFLLISDLARAGIRQINNVYFDNRFRYFQEVENSATHHTEITQNGGVSRQTIANQLMHLLNTRSWTKGDRRSYAEFVQVAQVVGTKVSNLNQIDLKTLDVTPVESNPLAGREGLRTYSSYSPEIMNYLKVMNMYSMNYPADELFLLYGGRNSFSQFLVKELHISEEDAHVFTGSGLPSRNSGRRADTTTSCEVLISVIEAMKVILKKNNLELSNIMMVGGVDRGTLNGVYKEGPMRGAVIAKTGTLANATTLAGYINTKQGQVHFGIFFQTNNVSRARAARNQLLQKIANGFGGPKPLNYHHGFQFVSFGPQSSLHLEPNTDNSPLP